MDISALLKSFCSAVERRDGQGFASLFTEDGVYHDVFYGDFRGSAKIAEMIDDWFHRTARDFRWEMHRPVSDGKMLYAYYTFSYVSTLPEAEGKRVGFEGCSMMTLRDGKVVYDLNGLARPDWKTLPRGYRTTGDPRWDASKCSVGFGPGGDVPTIDAQYPVLVD